MKGSNNKTIEAYEEDVQGYIDNTPQEVSGEHKDWMDKALSNIPEGGAVLEIGSAFGRDAKYIKERGFSITVTGATRGFVEKLKEDGYEAKELNILTDKIEGEYDLVFANAVFLHFTPEEFRNALIKAKKALKPGGVLAFTVKEGDGANWADHKLKSPRFFQYWKKGSLEQLLRETGYEDIRTDILDGRRGTNWLQVVAK